MALQAEIIPFTLPTPSGATSFSVSHIQYPSMTGKAVILISASGVGTNSYATHSFGVDDGATHLGTGLAFTETFGVSFSARSLSNGYSLVKEQSQAFFGGYSARALGYVSAFHAGSFDIVLDLNETPGAQWYAVVIGGTDIEAQVVDYTSNSPGTQSLSFDPIALIKLGTTSSGTTESGGAAQGFGFATPCHTKQAAWGLSCGASSSVARSIQIADIIDAAFDTSSVVGNPPSRERTISSYPSNGFAVGGDTMVGGDFRLGVLALGGSGLAANLVPITQPNASGVQATTIDAVSPKLVLFGSACLNESLTSVQANGNVMFGAYDGTNQLSAWIGTQDGAAYPYQFHSLLSTSDAVTLATATGRGSSTVNASAAASLASTSVGLNWGSADSTPRQVWALVLADAISSPCGSGATPDCHLVVTKTTSPSGSSTLFHFTTTGGLIPSDFTLADGQSRTFDVSAGTYGVTEDAYAEWTTGYSVTGGASHTAVALTSGQTKTIAVTNTRRFTPSGETVQWRIHRFDIKSRNEQTG